jgi:Arc/MetJ-type ribon-helix-helix transcriptional regulator
MAEVQQQQVLPAPHIEAASKVYLEDLAKGIGAARQVDLTKLYGQQFVAPESALTQQARALAPGLGGYQPYLQQAQDFQLAAQASTGPQAYQQYMSPYQQAVIDTSLREYDIQSQKGLPALAAQAIAAGAYGGGREGVQRAEYQSMSDRNRAALLAQLQQQGYGQAQQAAQQNYLNQLNLGQAAMGLGQQTQGLLGTQIAGLQTLGAGETSQQQAILEAQRQLAQQQAYQPLNVAERYGAGITPLIAGYPGREMTSITPSPSPLQNILGIGSTLAGIYGKINPAPLFSGPAPTSSDMRLKENINLIEKSPSGINIYTFKYKGEDNGIYKGVMAQEVPYASVLDKDGFYKVDYSKIDVRFEKVS